MLCRIIADYENVDGWRKDQIVDISDPKALIEQGLVISVEEEQTRERIKLLPLKIMKFNEERETMSGRKYFNYHWDKSGRDIVEFKKNVQAEEEKLLAELSHIALLKTCVILAGAYRKREDWLDKDYDLFLFKAFNDLRQTLEVLADETAERVQRRQV